MLLKCLLLPNHFDIFSYIFQLSRYYQCTVATKKFFMYFFYYLSLGLGTYSSKKYTNMHANMLIKLLKYALKKKKNDHIVHKIKRVHRM
jgi:hypothetical protein